MKKILIIATALLIPSLASAATLSVSPASQTVSVGDTLTVSVNLNTQNASIDGVDLRYLNFNPLILQVVDADASKTGTQIAPGALMPTTISDSVDNRLGRIVFSQVTSGGGAKYSGSGVLATVTFKAIAGGTAPVTFDYTPNKTTDSNVASAGADVLTSVVNGSYIVNGPAAQGTIPTASGINTGVITPAVPQLPVGTRSQCSSLAPLPAVAASLSFGSRGTNVSTLQGFLVSKGYLTNDLITGYYGSLTQAAVGRYNSNAACAPGQAISSSVFSRSLTLGSTGSDVKALQKYLNSHGYTVASAGPGSRGQETTYFGPATLRAVAAFQRAKSITPAAGYFGPVTRGYIK